MRGALLAVWEGPQNVLGLALLGVLAAAGRVEGVARDRGRLFVETRGLGVSLGWFVFWSRRFGATLLHDPVNRDHEYGHTLQSRWFGPAYLLLVGVPSVSRVVYGQLHAVRTGRPWAGYFDGWPERQADRLGGVARRRRGPGAHPVG